MTSGISHSWNVSPSQAVEVQKELRSQIVLEPYNGPLDLIAGADISFNKYSPIVYAGIVVLDAKKMEMVECVSAIVEVAFPYIPGLLSFRELPPLLEAYKKLRTQPDVFICDGQGIAHPRRLGIASHLGLILNKSTIGCAKTLLTGTFEGPGTLAGSWEMLVDRKRNEQIGAVVRTKTNVKPVFVSPGHRMDFLSAIKILNSTVRGYRIPEPTRQAHLYANQLRLAHHSSKSSSSLRRIP